MKPIYFLTALLAFICLNTHFSYAADTKPDLIIYKVTNPPTIDANPNDWTGSWIEIGKYKGTTFNMTSQFQMAYDDLNLYVIIETKDSTPNNDTVNIPNTYERDCNELRFAMHIDTEPRIHEGYWLLRKQRSPVLDGIDGNYGKMSESAWNIAPLLKNPNFKVISGGTDILYYTEWQIPWDSLTCELGKNDFAPWDKLQFKFDINVSDNTTGFASGRTLIKVWQDDNDLAWTVTTYYGLVSLGGIKYSNIQSTNNQDIIIYPSVAEKNINIRASSEIYRYELFNLEGKMLQSNKVHANNTTVDISGISSGFYILRATMSSGFVSNKKFYKK